MDDADDKPDEKRDEDREQDDGDEKKQDGGDQDGDGHDGDGQDDGDHQGDGEKGDDEFHAPKAKWPWFVGGAIILIFVIVVLLLIFWPRSTVKTDDAYVTAHYAMIAPRVSGQVARVLVEDNQPVSSGQLIVEIDPAPLRAQLDQALATEAQDRAQVEQAQAQVDRQPALIEQADAQVAAADATLILSRANARRYTNLAATGAGSEQLKQQSVSQLRQDEASRKQADANLTAARRQLEALHADRASARARLDSDAAAVRQARLNLGYTRVIAPIDGTVDRRSVQVGNYVTPGAAMMTLVPLHDVYIEANYRELALRHMAPGQHARIHVDAYDLYLDGFVQSLPPSSGAAYSPIPPNNATGNFTKIVQRLPVKIVVAPNQPLARLLRVGMSVETWVDTGLHDVVAAQANSNGRVTAVDPRAPVVPPGTRP